MFSIKKQLNFLNEVQSRGKIMSDCTGLQLKMVSNQISDNS